MKLSIKNLMMLLLVLSVATASLVSLKVLAQAEDEESSITAERAKNRRYSGGRDEQDLTVQASLPLPTRNADAPRPTPALVGSEAESSND